MELIFNAIIIDFTDTVTITFVLVYTDFLKEINSYSNSILTILPKKISV
jgi:hypothetical protein